MVGTKTSGGQDFTPDPVVKDYSAPSDVWLSASTPRRTPPLVSGFGPHSFTSALLGRHKIGNPPQCLYVYLGPLA